MDDFVSLHDYSASALMPTIDKALGIYGLTEAEREIILNHRPSSVVEFEKIQHHQRLARLGKRIFTTLGVVGCLASIGSLLHGRHPVAEEEIARVEDDSRMNRHTSELITLPNPIGELRAMNAIPTDVGEEIALKPSVASISNARVPSCNRLTWNTSDARMAALKKLESSIFDGMERLPVRVRFSAARARAEKVLGTTEHTTCLTADIRRAMSIHMDEQEQHAQAQMAKALEIKVPHVWPATLTVNFSNMLNSR